MNDVELEERVRRTYRAVADRTVVNLDHEALMHTYGGEPRRDGRVSRLNAGRGQRPVRPYGRPRRMTVVGIAAALVVLVGAVTVILAGSDGRDQVATGPDVGRWQPLPDSPVEGWGGGTVWTGTEVIEFGGMADGPLTGAAAYDPARQSWRPLADLPEEVRGASIGVWTGTEVLAFAPEAPGVGAALNPTTNQWRLLADPAIPYLNVESYAFWTGDKVLLAGFQSSNLAENTLGAGAALYDPVAGQWQTLPDAPQPLAPSSDAVWTGQEMIVVGQSPGSDEMTALALDPAVGAWRALPAPPLSTREGPLVAWTGSELVVVGGSSPADDQHPGGAGLRDGAVLDPATDTWAPYPEPPVAVFGNDVAADPIVAAVGSQVVAIRTDDPDLRPLVLDTATRTWQLGVRPPGWVPDRSNWIAVSTGHDVFVKAVLADEPGGRDSAVFSFSPSGS